MAEGCEDSAGVTSESTTSQYKLDKMLGTVLPCEASIVATPGSSSNNSSSSNIVKREFCDGINIMPGASVNNNNSTTSNNNNNNNNNTKLQALICNSSNNNNNNNSSSNNNNNNNNNNSSSSSSSSSSSCSSTSSTSSSAASTLTSCTTAAVVPSNCSTNANKSPGSPYSQSGTIGIGTLGSIGSIGIGVALASPLRDVSPLPSRCSPAAVAAQSPSEGGATPASPPSVSSNSSSHVLALTIKTESVSR
ncbi:hypothetical protein ACLKA7_013658 [Drosophila subpalustris]